VTRDRQKISKSKGNAAGGPGELIDSYGADALRYWAASGRPGVDTALDEGQLRVGRRLATKLLNASRFVLGLAEEGGGTGDVTEPLDRALLASLSTRVAAAAAALDAYDHTAALTAVEGFFWEFCDDFIELVKERAYGSGPGALSARAALATALSVQLRLFAPFLPYVTEEVWSWWREGSVHRAPWPTPDELAIGGDPGILAVASSALGEVRREKSKRSLSMRAEVARVDATAPPAILAMLELAAADLRAATRIGELRLLPGGEELTIACEF
jgi:valyl-tRNA synthetase